MKEKERSSSVHSIHVSENAPLKRVFACFDCLPYEIRVFRQIVNLIANCMSKCGRIVPYMEIDQFLGMERQHFEKLFIILFWFWLWLWCWFQFSFDWTKPIAKFINMIQNLVEIRNTISWAKKRRERSALNVNINFVSADCFAGLGPWEWMPFYWTVAARKTLKLINFNFLSLHYLDLICLLYNRWMQNCAESRTRKSNNEFQLTDRKSALNLLAKIYERANVRAIFGLSNGNRTKTLELNK